MLLSLFHRASDATGAGETTAADAVAMIRSDRHRDRVKYIRRCIIEGDDDAMAEAKHQLEAVTWSGTFARRQANACTAYSRLVCIDIDGKDNPDLDPVECRDEWADRTVAAFVSPSGAGVKLIFKTEATHASEHKSAFAGCKSVVMSAGLVVDESGSDVSRLCFMSWDPGATYNPDAVAVPVMSGVMSGQHQDTGTVAATVPMKVTSGRHQWLLTLVGRLIRSGLSAEATTIAARSEWAAFVVGRDPAAGEIEAAVAGAVAKYSGQAVPVAVAAELQAHGDAVAVALTTRQAVADEPEPVIDCGRWPVIDLPGIGGRIVQDLRESAPRFQPVLALGAALALGAVVTGRRIRSARGAVPTLYVLGVGPTSCGKDAPMTYCKRALTLAGAEKYLGPGTFASGAAIESAMVDHPSMLAVVDEMGPYLASTTSKKAATYERAIATNLLKMWSSCHSTYVGSAYADRKKKETPLIHNPNLVLFGGGNPTQVWQGLTPTDFASGLAARMLFLSVDDAYPAKTPGAGSVTVSAAVVDWIQAWIGSGTDMQMMSNLPASPITVPIDDDAAAVADAHDAKCESLLVKAEPDSIEQTLCGKLSEQAGRLALILSSFRCKGPEQCRISVDDVRTAVAVVDHAFRTVVRDASRRMHLSEFDAVRSEALEWLRGLGADGASGSRWAGWISRKGNPRLAGDVLASLRESGQIWQVRLAQTGAGRPGARIVHRSYPVPAGEVV